VFLEAAGFSELQAFDVNISLSACYIIGGIICWLMFPHLGRATIYMGGLTLMFFCLVAIGGLGWSSSKHAQLAIGILLVVSTLINMITVGPTCYPIVAETPSGRLRYKTIVVGRFVYNLTGIFNNSVTPRMIAADCKFGLRLHRCWVPKLTIRHSVELGCKDGPVLRRHQPALQHLVLVSPS
jgi:SP family general alpha glucoside:H+ symporter-like MFS transporter